MVKYLELNGLANGTRRSRTESWGCGMGALCAPTRSRAGGGCGRAGSALAVAGISRGGFLAAHYAAYSPARARTARRVPCSCACPRVHPPHPPLPSDAPGSLCVRAYVGMCVRTCRCKVAAVCVCGSVCGALATSVANSHFKNVHGTTIFPPHPVRREARLRRTKRAPAPAHMRAHATQVAALGMLSPVTNLSLLTEFQGENATMQARRPGPRSYCTAAGGRLLRAPVQYRGMLATSSAYAGHGGTALCGISSPPLLPLSRRVSTAGTSLAAGPTRSGAPLRPSVHIACRVPDDASRH